MLLVGNDVLDLLRDSSSSCFCLYERNTRFDLRTLLLAPFFECVTLHDVLCASDFPSLKFGILLREDILHLTSINKQADNKEGQTQIHTQARLMETMKLVLQEDEPGVTSGERN